MAKDKKIHWDKIRSPLQRLFVKRLGELMKDKGVSDNELANRCDTLGMPVGQSSISRITGGRQDPTILIVHAIASALDVSAHQLFSTPPPKTENVSTNVKQFPTLPEIFGQKGKTPSKRLVVRRKTSV